MPAPPRREPPTCSADWSFCSGPSLVLLVAAGLFIQSLNKARGTDMRLDANNRYIIHVNPQAAGYKTTEVEALYRSIEDRFHALPGVVKSASPLIRRWKTITGNRCKSAGRNRPAQGILVGQRNSGIFDSVGTHLVMGRGFTPQDVLGAPRLPW